MKNLKEAKQVIEKIRWIAAYAYAKTDDASYPNIHLKQMCMDSANDYLMIISACNSFLNDKIPDPFKMPNNGTINKILEKTK
jgi:hypothetical protein